jgi:hypothetical protein
VKGGEEGEHHGSHQDEVEVGDDEVRVLPVDGEARRGERDAGHAAEDEQEQEAEQVDGRRLQRDGAPVERLMTPIAGRTMM